MWIILPQAPPTCLCNVEKLWHAVKRWMFFGQPLTGKEQYIVNWWPGAHTKANRIRVRSWTFIFEFGLWEKKNGSTTTGPKCHGFFPQSLGPWLFKTVLLNRPLPHVRNNLLMLKQKRNALRRVLALNLGEEMKGHEKEISVNIWNQLAWIFENCSVRWPREKKVLHSECHELILRCTELWCVNQVD